MEGGGGGGGVGVLPRKILKTKKAEEAISVHVVMKILPSVNEQFQRILLPFIVCSFLNIKFRKICILSVLVLGCRWHRLDLTTLDNDIRKSGHYAEVNKPNRCYPLIFVGPVTGVGRVSNLESWVLQVLFPGGPLQKYLVSGSYLRH